MNAKSIYNKSNLKYKPKNITTSNTNLFKTSESDIQKALFQHLKFYENKYPEIKLLFHIPNGGTRNVLEAVSFKAEGVKSGVPDLFLPVARKGYNGLFIEMKSKEGKLSENQQKWLAELYKNNYKIIISDSDKIVLNIIIDYLK